LSSTGSAANQKFERRFRFIEQALRDTHRAMEDCTLEDLDALWGEAKRQEHNLPSCG
jgi:ATP diphosphatase